MATTPCPHCREDVPVPDGDEGTCPACDRPLRFLDVPERPCGECGAGIALQPGADTVVCSRCRALQAAEEGRALRFVARCPRCRRRIDVPADAPRHTCPHCHAAMRLQDTL